MTMIDAQHHLAHSALTAAPGQERGSPGPAACIVLAGALKASPLAEACGCAVLDLAVTPARTVLGLWLDRIGSLDSGASPPVRVVHNPQAQPPSMPGHGAVSIEADAREYRGPAGVVRDVCEGYPPDSVILVVEGARCLTGSLAGLLRSHAAGGAAVTVGCNANMSPAGVYAIGRSALDLVPRSGFLDLKEQWIARVVGAGMPVRVHALPQGESYGLRTLGEYIKAAAAVNGRGAAPGSVVEAGAPLFRVVQEGAEVDSTAIVADSVVMSGARVGAGAVVARSLLCPGAVVRPGAEVIDRVVAGPRKGAGRGGRGRKGRHP